jgi:protein-tyrosine phosphatase
MKCAPSIKEVNPEVKCQQLCIAVDDTEEEDLLQSFQIGVEYIREGLAAGGVVLVHCIAGVSRSCTASSQEPLSC